MSNLPPIPPRPNRANSRSPAPAPASTESTLGSDIPIIPPRPKRRIDRSASPSKSHASSVEEPHTVARSASIPIFSSSELSTLEKPVTPPTTITIPDLNVETLQREQEHTPVPDIRGIPEDLELQAPEPTVPRNSENTRSEKMAAITRTDSAQAASLDLDEKRNDDKPAASQLQPETHTAIMESSGGQPQQVREMEDEQSGIDSVFPGTAEVACKPMEVGDDGVVLLGVSKGGVADAPSTPEHATALEEKNQDQDGSQLAADENNRVEPMLASKNIENVQASSTLESTIANSHDYSPRISRSDIQLENKPVRDQDTFEHTALNTERLDETGKVASAPELESTEKYETTETEKQKPESSIEHSATSDAKDDKDDEPSVLAPQQELATSKNEVDEVLGSPTEPVKASDLAKESALGGDSEDKEGSPKDVVSEALNSSLDSVSDVKGEHMETHIPEERPTTGAVAFHQEKQAEGIPLSYEEGRATTGVASVIKPAVPPRPAKKLADPKPILVPILPQNDGPPPTDRSPTCPSGPKPPVPLASKPAIPPRPARPPRPVKKDSLNGSEGAPLTTISSASSARSLFEAGGPEAAAAAAAKAKPKPPVPSRPIGSKIAALQGGFMSELNKRLKVGPTAPVKEEPQVEEKVEQKEVKPLVDARKGRARGPARRAPAKVETKAKDASPKPALAAAKQEFNFSPPTTVWEVSPEDGDIKLPSGVSTPKAEEAEDPLKPEIVVKSDAPEVIESKPEIAEEAPKATEAETKELGKAQQEMNVASPPAQEEPQQQEAETSAPTWTGTAALGALAMSAREVIEQTASSASKTIKDFTEGEEHVLSDVGNSPAASDDDLSAPASPKIQTQNDGPSEIEAEAEAEELAASESAAPAEAAVPSGIPSVHPPSMEATQHPSKTENPAPLTSSEAPTALEAKAAGLINPENAVEPLRAVTSHIPSAEPPQMFVEYVPVPAAVPASPKASGVATHAEAGEEMPKDQWKDGNVGEGQVLKSGGIMKEEKDDDEGKAGVKQE